MLGNPNDSGHGFSEPPTGAGLGASNSIRPHSDNRATTATISTSVSSTDRGSASGTKETLSVSESSATVNSRSQPENLGTKTKLFPISDPSKHLVFLSEAFPYIPDNLGRYSCPIGVLRLLIIKASGLTNFNRAGNPNSFVSVNGKSIRSGSHQKCNLVAYDNPSPRYNEVLYITIHNFQGKLTMGVHDPARGESTHQSLGTVTIDPLDYISQSQEGEYVSHRRTDRRQLDLSGRLCGTLEFEVSFYPCVRLVTKSEDSPNVPQELIAAQRLPSKVFIGFNESLSYKSGVLFFKLDWGSKPPENAALYVEDLTSPYYRFNSRQGFTSGTFYIGSCFVRDVRVGRIVVAN
ncbi:hypothetical protein QBC37DRAFT_37959 [Rhypophila decipiens]|uniref:C2 domain-containing protein n=1 Tax=Rhypophila decipiens TaxID=261697 RepID=A0AAN6YFD1_9PEZI|nr:hypothetical protein QBC37DRAFT_37959 [Rhypophila decipiens]